MLRVAWGSYAWVSSILAAGVAYGVYRAYRDFRARREVERSDSRAVKLRSEDLKREIRERERTERVLRESESRYRALFESSPHPMWVYDDDTLAFVEVNGAALDYFQYSRDDFLARTVRDLCVLDPEAPPVDPRWPGIWTYRKKDGTEIQVETRSQSFRSGSRPSTLVLAEDITERLHAERLRIERDAAEAANRAKSEFLASMSHELRTPLNIIIGYSELLQDQPAGATDENLVPDLQKIHDAGRHLLGLINDILDFSKIEAGKMPVSLEEFDLESAIRGAAERAEGVIRANGNRLVVETEPDLGSLVSDQRKVEQVLGNLLDNAAKFTKDGTVRLCAARTRGGAGECVAIRVEDTGIGMTPSELEKVGRFFTQADASTTRRYGGSGLGLAISVRLCRMMGGELSAESTKGVGTTFLVRFPVGPGDAAPSSLDSSDRASPPVASDPPSQGAIR